MSQVDQTFLNPKAKKENNVPNCKSFLLLVLLSSLRTCTAWWCFVATVGDGWQDTTPAAQWSV